MRQEELKFKLVKEDEIKFRVTQERLQKEVEEKHRELVKMEEMASKALRSDDVNDNSDDVTADVKYVKRDSGAFQPKEHNLKVINIAATIETNWTLIFYTNIY